MKTGKMKFFNETKGFGFITEDNGNDIFVHVTGLADRVKNGDNVTFEVKDGLKGISATNVKLVKSL